MASAHSMFAKSVNDVLSITKLNRVLTGASFARIKTRAQRSAATWKLKPLGSGKATPRTPRKSKTRK